MFTSNDPKALRATLDCIPVAMFAAERPSLSDAFRLLCINRAHEDESGLSNVDVSGLRAADILPPNEAEAVESRYDFCVRQHKVIQYREVLHLSGQTSHWRTILHPVDMPGTTQRIIGTAFALSPDGRFPAALPVIEAAMASLRSSPALASFREPRRIVAPQRIRHASIVLGQAEVASVLKWPTRQPANNPATERIEAT